MTATDIYGKTSFPDRRARDLAGQRVHYLRSVYLPEGVLLSGLDAIGMVNVSESGTAEIRQTGFIALNDRNFMLGLFIGARAFSVLSMAFAFATEWRRTVLLLLRSHRQKSAGE